MSDQKILVVVRSGPIPGSSFYIEKEEVFVGRDQSNDMTIPDPEISRRHAHFLLKPEGAYIEDLGSTNGTFVNGVRLSAPQLLKNGDLITLAENTVMSIEMKDSPTEPTAIGTAPKVEPSLYVPEAEPIAPIPAEEVYRPVQAPVPQRPVAPAPAISKPKKKMGWCLVLLIILIACLVIIALVLTFMPATWWCALTFNSLPGCPIAP